MKDKVIAALLAFFLGSFGVHKFYLRKNIQGVLYFLFCWTGIPAILGIIEAVIYFFFTNEDKFNRKYNNRFMQNNNYRR